jgi:hypothetical protein
VERICRTYRVAPKIHRSVFEGISRGTEGYAPGVIPPDCHVISSTASPTSLASIAATVKAAFNGKPPLIEQQHRARRVGVRGYWLLILTVLSLGALMIGTFAMDIMRTAHGWRDQVKLVASSAVSSHWLNIAARTI